MLVTLVHVARAKGIVGVNHSDVDTDILVFKSNGGEMWIKGEQECVEEMFIQKVQVRGKWYCTGTGTFAR